MNSIAAKLESQTRLTFEDGLGLFATRDIHTLGELANAVRERLHGRRAYYIVNRHINYTNYCVLRCKFCSFFRPYPRTARAEARGSVEDGSKENGAVAAGSVRVGSTEDGRGVGVADCPAEAGPQGGGGYELTVEQVVEQAAEACERGATEVHVVGGLHPKLPFSYYLNLCRGIRRRCPKMHVKAFTAVEIIHISRIVRPRLTVAEVLTQLGEAGLGSLPGGGAEIFNDRVHDEAFKAKVGETEWFQVHAIAHKLGIFTNATMLYGHVETPAERVGHLLKLREHQDESLRSRRAHFNCLVPLPFVPEGSALADLPGPTGLDDLKTLAVSRLILDNVPHVKAFWPMLSPKLAQVSLNWGVDDIDGTVVHYDVTKREGRDRDKTHQELSVDELQRLICEAGCQPVERDSLYRRVIRAGRDWRVTDE